MATLKPNTTYTVNGVLVNEKIIPDDMIWTNHAKATAAGFGVGSPYKKNQRLCGNSGKVKWITIHNTDDLPGVEDDGEQYTRATYNENMGSVRVHYYVDDKCAWQNLRAGTGMSVNDPEDTAEVSWHAGDGSVSDGGNMTSLSIEIIMDGVSASDESAKDNGARLAAWLLRKHGLTIDELVTHTYWVHKICGNSISSRDDQCVTPIGGQKWCPKYIFADNNLGNALKNWMAFKSLVKKYYDGEQTPKTSNNVCSDSEDVQFKNGDLVSISDDAVYYSGQAMPDWVKAQNWYICDVSGDRAVINENENGTNAICSPVNIKYLSIVNKSTGTASREFTPYLVKLTSKDIPIFSGAGTYYTCTGHITDMGVYTIVKEAYGSGAHMWGKLKSGAGWIPLDFSKRI